MADEVAGEPHGLRHSHVQEEGCSTILLCRRGDEVGAHIFDDVNAVVSKQVDVNRECHSSALRPE